MVEDEQDLGVIMQNDLMVSKQCSKVVKTANRILGMIYRTVCYKTKNVILQLYKSLVRPHLEYCVQAWRPYLKKDINLIEKVQRRATRMIPALHKMPYELRLKELKLTTLETRRLRGDLIEVFKILKGFEEVDSSYFFELTDTHLRGNSWKLYKSRFEKNWGKFAFTNRIIDEWNRLNDEVVSSNTIDNFKIKLDYYLKNCRGFI